MDIPSRSKNIEFCKAIVDYINLPPHKRINPNYNQDFAKEVVELGRNIDTEDQGASSAIGYGYFEKILGKSRSYLENAINERIERLKIEDPENPAFLSFGLLGGQSLWNIHETMHSKLLAWFLDPTQAHGFGDKLRNSFLSVIESHENSVNELEVSRVNTEWKLPKGNERIDIVIECTNRNDRSLVTYIFVEMKVRSDEGRDQLEKYDHGIDLWLGNDESSVAIKIFLTPDRRESETSSNSWIPIDFEYIARELWKSARKEKDAPGYQLLRYYIASILRDICDWPLPIDQSTSYQVINL